MAPQTHPTGEDTLLGTVRDPSIRWSKWIRHGCHSWDPREEMEMKMEIACDGMGWMTDSGSLADELCGRLGGITAPSTCRAACKFGR
jgi:hypothetical protein